MELARRKATRQAALAPVTSIPGISLGDEKDFPWLGVTVVLGCAFLVGQWLAWGELHTRGFLLATNPSSSFAFLLTITHAVHLAGGMIALMWAASASLLHKPLESRGSPSILPPGTGTLWRCCGFTFFCCWVWCVEEVASD